MNTEEGTQYEEISFQVKKELAILVPAIIGALRELQIAHGEIVEHQCGEATQLTIRVAKGDSAKTVKMLIDAFKVNHIQRITEFARVAPMSWGDLKIVLKALGKSTSSCAVLKRSLGSRYEKGPSSEIIGMIIDSSTEQELVDSLSTLNITLLLNNFDLEALQNVQLAIQSIRDAR